jgi:hypothetical protein
MLKPQDILVLLKLHTWQKAEWTYTELATSLYMSASEVHAALQRSAAAGLYDAESRQVRNQPLLEFLIHGIRYAFFTQPGALSRGMPTAHSAEPLKTQIVSSPNDIYVWADRHGTVKGQAIAPLYKSVPEAAKQDQELYEMLCLVDAIRVGRMRERQLATQVLEQRLMAS